MKNTRKLCIVSLVVAVAMILSYVETLIPVFVAIPGVKIGLSNIATVFALYTLGAPYAVAVTFVRVVLSSLLFANFASLFISLSGAAFALVFMILLKRLDSFSSVGVSVVGGVSHNAGQVFAAAILLENAVISYYFVPLIISGTIAGVAVGIAASILVKRLSPYLKI